MKQAPPLIVFSDLDGTLLSHENYSWSAARPALAKLAAIGAGVVLASSKTAPEIDLLRRDMGLADWPAIVENGAGLLDPHMSAPEDRSAYTRLRAALDALPTALRAKFRGFGDMSVDDVSAATGLDAPAARLAQTRAYSEPGLWSGSEDERAEFLAHLSERGVHARQGGRFWTLSFGRTKADQMERIISQYRPAHTIALGDAPNDVEMLEAADVGVIVANPHRTALPTLRGEAEGRIIRTQAVAPEGWNAAILAQLTRLDFHKG